MIHFLFMKSGWKCRSTSVGDAMSRYNRRRSIINRILPFLDWGTDAGVLEFFIGN